MSVTHATALRVDFANLKTGQSTSWSSGSSQKLVIYSGTPPTNAGTALSGNTAISTITALVWGTPNSTTGVTTITSSTADPGAVGGTASFYRITTSGGTAIEQGLVTTSGGGGDLIISSTTIAAGAAVSLTGTNTYTPTP